MTGKFETPGIFKRKKKNKSSRMRGQREFKTNYSAISPRYIDYWIDILNTGRRGKIPLNIVAYVIKT